MKQLRSGWVRRGWDSPMGQLEWRPCALTHCGETRLNGDLVGDAMEKSKTTKTKEGNNMKRSTRIGYTRFDIRYVLSSFVTYTQNSLEFRKFSDSQLHPTTLIICHSQSSQHIPRFVLCCSGMLLLLPTLDWCHACTVRGVHWWTSPDFIFSQHPTLTLTDPFPPSLPPLSHHEYSCCSSSHRHAFRYRHSADTGDARSHGGG